MVLLQRATEECLAGSEDGDADSTRRRLTPRSLADFGELLAGNGKGRARRYDVVACLSELDGVDKGSSDDKYSMHMFGTRESVHGLYLQPS